MKILFKPPTQTLTDPSVIARDLEYVLFSRIMPLKVATSKLIILFQTDLIACIQVGIVRRLLQRFGSCPIQSLPKLCNSSPLYYKTPKFHLHHGDQLRLRSIPLAKFRFKPRVWVSGGFISFVIPQRKLRICIAFVTRRSGCLSWLPGRCIYPAFLVSSARLWAPWLLVFMTLTFVARRCTCLKLTRNPFKLVRLIQGEREYQRLYQ